MLFLVCASAFVVGIYLLLGVFTQGPLAETASVTNTPPPIKSSPQSASKTIQNLQPPKASLKTGLFITVTTEIPNIEIWMTALEKSLTARARESQIYVVESKEKTAFSANINVKSLSGPTLMGDGIHSLIKADLEFYDNLDGHLIFVKDVSSQQVKLSSGNKGVEDYKREGFLQVLDNASNQIDLLANSYPSLKE